MRKALPFILAFVLLEPIKNEWIEVTDHTGRAVTCQASFCEKVDYDTFLQCYLNTVDGAVKTCGFMIYQIENIRVIDEPKK